MDLTEMPLRLLRGETRGGVFSQFLAEPGSLKFELPEASKESGAHVVWMLEPMACAPSPEQSDTVSSGSRHWALRRDVVECSSTLLVSVRDSPIIIVMRGIV